MYVGSVLVTDLLWVLCMLGQCWWIDLLALCMSGQRWWIDLLRELCMTEESNRVRFCCLWLCPLVFVWHQARAVNLPFCVGFVDGKAEEGRKKERKTERRRE